MLSSRTGTWTDALKGTWALRYFGLRIGVLGMVGTVANLIAAAWLDRVQAPLGFQPVLIAAVASGVLAAVILTRHDESPLIGARLHMRSTFTLPTLT